MTRTLIFDLSRDAIRREMLEVARAAAPSIDYETLVFLVESMLNALAPEFKNEYYLGFNDGESEHAHDEWRKNWAANKMGPY